MRKFLFGFGGLLALALVITLTTAGNVMALGLDLSTITIDTEQVMVLAGIIVAAIAGIWVVKKVIKLANRS